MTILSSFLPGVRELRAPLAAGLLWLGVMTIIIGPHQAAYFPHSPAIDSLQHLLVRFPFLLGSIAVGLAYLIGLVAIGTMSQLIRAIGRVLHVLVIRFSRERDGWVRRRGLIAKPFRFLDDRTSSVSLAARSLVIDAVTKTLTQAGVSGTAAMIFPVETAISNLHFGAPQLAQTAPSQYQEYDRARAEKEFRLAVVPPLAALSLVAPIPWRIWLIVAMLGACAVLLAQAIKQSQLANDLLANAAFLDYITIPSAQAIVDFINGLPQKPTTDGACLGAIIAGLYQRGNFDDADAAIGELTFWAMRDEAREFLHIHGFDDLVATLDRHVKANSPAEPDDTEGPEQALPDDSKPVSTHLPRRSGRKPLAEL